MPEFEDEAPAVRPSLPHDADKSAQTDPSRPDNSIQSGGQASPIAPHSGPVVEYSPPRRPPGSGRNRETNRTYQSKPKESFRTQRRKSEERRSITRRRFRSQNKGRYFPRKKLRLWSRISSFFKALFGGLSKKSRPGGPSPHRRKRRRRNRSRRYNQNNPRFSGRSSSHRQSSEDDRRGQSSGRSGGSRRRSRGRRPRKSGFSQDSTGQSKDR